MSRIYKTLALMATLALAACGATFASPSYDLHRSNVQACGPDVGVSATGFTLVAGEIHRFVTPSAAAKYDFSCRDNVTVLPANVDAYNQGQVEAYLAAAGYSDVRAVLSDKYECTLALSDRDPDAANVADMYGDGYGCYENDNASGTYGDEAIDIKSDHERW